ncbi:MAG: hypothetical protein Ct9H300mP12_13960 [Acidimicrobiales bacterium]|nr:MAG: hypothetical protein Ct9H300mP12_13960 [Acidimicrobiales bacterium]
MPTIPVDCRNLWAPGCDGIERSLELPPISEGDMYTEPGDCVPLATDLTGAIEAFEGSGMASMLGDEFSRSFVSLAREEERLAAENNPDPETSRLGTCPVPRVQLSRRGGGSQRWWKRWWIDRPVRLNRQPGGLLEWHSPRRIYRKPGG